MKKRRESLLRLPGNAGACGTAGSGPVKERGEDSATVKLLQHIRECQRIEI